MLKEQRSDKSDGIAKRGREGDSVGYFLKRIALKLGEHANKIDASNILEQLSANDIVTLIKDIIL